MCVLLGSVGFILGFISTVYIVYCVSVWALLPDLNKLDWIGLEYELGYIPADLLHSTCR